MKNQSKTFVLLLIVVFLFVAILPAQAKARGPRIHMPDYSGWSAKRLTEVGCNFVRVFGSDDVTGPIHVIVSDSDTSTVLVNETIPSAQVFGASQDFDMGENPTHVNVLVYAGKSQSLGTTLVQANSVTCPGEG